ncbi:MULTISPECIES: DeoR/GlpR family DNA-binding transcription regulator [unclassified Leifsonia]|uniref:DeoR/GlpR family DNA-binding transcription regulator n=1 Tax=unclassified Leifsonia TaxID=2663824 RepID=UPI0006F35DAD|nr:MULTISPECIES: DeoR/GlpR family DNA-binding transcription regulator [unclassified Leifsonia]KQX07832.1 DeoR family transcriptional regulator [Leifsonia sp. Root1293]KRA12113.1 DeoR family transcriptional regulator [Leifsonia sp. Root60]
MTSTDRDIGNSVPAGIRRNRAAALVADRGFVRVRDLAVAFGVTDVTARADLDQLEREGLIRRVHGGAVPSTDAAATAIARRPEREPSFEEALAASAGPKESIGQTAAALVSSGQSVILDVGTTTLQVARSLRARRDLDDVTIFTNGLSIALELESAIPRFTVVLTGGTLRPRQHSLVDPLARGILADLRADIAFIGCNGVDVERGVTNANLPEAAVKIAMIRAAGRAVVVADSSKLGEVHLARISRLDEVDTLVTDAAAPAVLLGEFEQAGLAVLPAGSRLSA